MNQQILTLLPLVLLLFLMYFLMIRPQKKRERAVNEMRSKLKSGDQVISIGGIRGKILKVKDESITVEVGADKLKMELMKWAIQKVENESDEKQPAKVVKDETDKSAEEEAPKRTLKKAPSIKKSDDIEPGSPEIK